MNPHTGQSVRAHRHGDPWPPVPYQTTLERMEWELRRLRERQANQVHDLSRGLERAVLGARREERRLVERVEQDSRDIQCHLEHLQRENTSAVSAAQSQINQRLQQLIQLRQQIQRHPDRDQLLKRVSQLLQPWEITLSLKSVSCWPQVQPSCVTFGEVQVQECSLSFAVGAHEIQGQQVAPHTETADMGETSSTASSGPHGVMKTCLSSPNGEELHFSRLRYCPLLQDTTDGSLSQVGLLTLGSHAKGKRTFRAAPAATAAPDGRESEGMSQKRNGNKTQHAGERLRNEGIRVSLITRPPHDTPKGGRWYCLTRSPKCRYGAVSYPRITQRPPLGTQSCMDLTLQGSCCPCLSFCVNNQPLMMAKEMVNTPSPANSPRFTSPWDYKYSLTQKPHLSRSMVNLSSRSLSCNVDKHRWCSIGGHHCSPASATLERSRQVLGRSVDLPGALHGEATQMFLPLSALAVERGGMARPTQMESRGRSRPMEAVRLLRRFGKKGSGRADFSMPGGLHATPQGQLFVVDCGNARVQVLDSWGHVLQKVTSLHPQGSSGPCCDYFDVAVSAKGLIAVSCVIQGALLIFSQYGCHLQTLGGAGLASKGELVAPRGVTVSPLDQFLVADIRRGLLTILKLDPRTGVALERTEVRGFHRPFLVSANLSTGLVVVSEKGGWEGRAPCVKVLGPDWTIIRTVGVCCPMLLYPWGVCIDDDGNVLVADWGQQHRVVMYPTQGVSRILVAQGLRSPRGLALLPEGQLVVADSMHHCIKVFQYKSGWRCLEGRDL